MKKFNALHLLDIETCKAIGKITNVDSDPLYCLPEDLWDAPHLLIVKREAVDVAVKDPRADIQWYVPYFFILGFVEVTA